MIDVLALSVGGLVLYSRSGHKVSYRIHRILADATLMRGWGKCVFVRRGDTSLQLVVLIEVITRGGRRIVGVSKVINGTGSSAKIGVRSHRKRAG